MKNTNWFKIFLYTVALLFLGDLLTLQEGAQEALAALILVIMLADIGLWYIKREKYKGTFLTKRKIISFSILLCLLYIYGVNETIGEDLLNGYYTFVIADVLWRKVRKRKASVSHEESEIVDIK